MTFMVGQIAIQIASRILRNPKIQGAIAGSAIGFGDALRQMIFPDEISRTVPPHKSGKRANIYNPSSRVGSSGSISEIGPSQAYTQYQEYRKRVTYRSRRRYPKDDHRECCQLCCTRKSTRSHSRFYN